MNYTFWGIVQKASFFYIRQARFPTKNDTIRKQI